VHHTSSNDVQIIADPSIPEFPTCVVEEEHHVTPPATKKKASAFVSILPRRRTRSTKSAEATIGWKTMEHAIPILHPLSSMVDEGTVTQEPVSSSQLTMLVETVANDGTGLQEQVMQDEVVPQEPVVQDETVPQEPFMTDPAITQETVVPQETTIDSITAPQEPVTHNTEDVPLAQLFAQIERKIRNKKISKITALITENESLKEELNNLKQEVETS
jgi:hypothetical protein